MEKAIRNKMKHETDTDPRLKMVPRDVEKISTRGSTASATPRIQRSSRVDPCFHPRLQQQPITAKHY